MKRILIIDDNGSNLDMLGRIFKAKGFNTLLMEGPADIGRVLTAFSPHVVLLDLMMGRAKGADICRDIKSSHKFSHTRVLLMAASDVFNTLDMTATHADGHIAKPINIAQITTLADTLL